MSRTKLVGWLAEVMSELGDRVHIRQYQLFLMKEKQVSLSTYI
jgi:hypothetical protein